MTSGALHPPACGIRQPLAAEPLALDAARRMRGTGGTAISIRCGRLNAFRRLLARASSIPITPIDYDEAAVLYRTCRRSGETVRRLIDCLIAATAIRAQAPVLHADRDFEVLARHTALQLDHP